MKGNAMIFFIEILTYKVNMEVNKMGAYKDKNGTWYAQFRFTNWKGEPDRKTKRGFATKREALDWERDFLTQSSGNLEMTFEAFYELYKKNMKERIKLSIGTTTAMTFSASLPILSSKSMMITT